MKEEIKDDLTYKIIGCAMKVHSVLGNGFQEIIYQRALVIEMKKQELNFARELKWLYSMMALLSGAEGSIFWLKKK